MINQKVRRIIKRVIKYLMNILAVVNAALLGLSPVWGWDTWRITESVTVVIGVLGLILLQQGVYKAYKDKQVMK